LPCRTLRLCPEFDRRYFPRIAPVAAGPPAHCRSTDELLTLCRGEEH
jgi:hypothetical protein